MWSYYGSKSKIIDLYPPPVCGKIIEPFAGTARYALKYFDREVTLVDKYPVIVAIWKWLQQCSEKDILGLPDIEPGQDISKLKLAAPEQSLIGFCINNGSAQPKRTPGAWSQDDGPSKDLISFSIGRGHWKPTRATPGKFCAWARDRRRIAKSLYKIRHWKIILGDYRDLENEQATWFIDPPYQFGGEYYRMSNKALDFQELAQWCKSRNGQVIVCENTKADWLPFNPMRKMRGSKYTTTEAIWSNMPTAWDMQQVSFLREELGQ